MLIKSVNIGEAAGPSDSFSRAKSSDHRMIIAAAADGHPPTKRDLPYSRRLSPKLGFSAPTSNPPNDHQLRRFLDASDMADIGPERA
jgi:hypothetical protein